MATMTHLGVIKITMDPAGEPMVGQGWNPTAMTKTVRRRVAEELRDIADNMMADKFEDDGGLKRYPPKKEPR